jgi:hypothetical protein
VLAIQSTDVNLGIKPAIFSEGGKYSKAKRNHFKNYETRISETFIYAHKLYISRILSVFN